MAIDIRLLDKVIGYMMENDLLVEDGVDQGTCVVVERGEVEMVRCELMAMMSSSRRAVRVAIFVV